MPPQVDPVSNAVQQLIAALNSFHGIVTRGNIDLAHRPRVQNPDGSTSSVYSMSFRLPTGQAILLPGVIKNAQGQWIRTKDPQLAWAYYKKTGQHLGIFQNEALAGKYSDLLHREQAAYYGQ